MLETDDTEPIETALDSLIDRRAVVETPVGRESACYLLRLWEAETYVDRRLRLMLAHRPDRGQNVDRIIDRIQAEQGIAYAPA